MIDQIMLDILGLLALTFGIVFLWANIRLEEINYEGDDDRLNPWMRAWSRKLPTPEVEPGKNWRWVGVEAILVIYAIYLVTFDRTPLLLKVPIAIFGLVVFGACVHYCDQKMGK
ncbi:MAG TPA: hypothetical protein VMP08_04375 [Anaerolineae bacterium]|nr:hypothetical protein [Anaerolineae bacterium]